MMHDSSARLRTARPRGPERLALALTLANALLCAVLLFGYFTSQSLLALAQAADSVVDVLLSTLLYVAARVARQPKDSGHPHGHRAAEPIAALITAVVATVMAVELVLAAIERLLGNTQVDPHFMLLAAFGAKGLVKFIAALVARRMLSRGGSPVAAALWVDSRNDTLVALVAVSGYFLASSGRPTWDAWLTLPIALWVAWTAWDLARRNITLLMGAAASPARHRELTRIVEGVPGIRNFGELVARYHGTHLEVSLHLVLEPTLPLGDAHRLGDAVVEALEAQGDVSRASVYFDVEGARPTDDDPSTVSS
jgi:cation diffusion facilitator family transporter